MSRPFPEHRSDYVYFQTMTTRWRDNDVYGHMNNAVYYEYIDAAVNGWILQANCLDIPHGAVVGLVVASDCTYFSALSYPDTVTVGLKVGALGNSSVQYVVGLFRADENITSAIAHFTHVYVDANTRKPVALPTKFRTGLQTLVLGTDKTN